MKNNYWPCSNPCVTSYVDKSGITTICINTADTSHCKPTPQKTTSSGYSNGWVNASSSRYNSAIRNLDKSLTTLPESTPYVRPEFVPYTPPVRSFLEEPKYIPPVIYKPIYYTSGDNYVIQELTTNLNTLQNLVCIDFSGKQLGNDSCKVLNEAFKDGKLPYLLTLVLTNNQIGDGGATYLADAIGRGLAPTLRSLFIDNNNLTCVGKESIVKMACQIQSKQKISVTVDYSIVFPNQQTDLIASNWYALQQKYSNVDVGYGKVHTHPIIGGSFYYRGIPFMNEVVDTVKEEVISKTLYQKLVINGYNRELVDSDLYYLGFSLSGSTKPTTSGVNLNLSLLDLHQNSIADPGIYNFVFFFKGQNIKEVNLSNNQIGDQGAKLLADSLAKGEMPKLKVLHLHGNKITDEGTKLFIKALESPNVTEVTVIFKITNKADEVKNFVVETIGEIKDFVTKGLNYAVEQHRQKQWEINKIRTNVEGEKWRDCKDTAINFGMGLVSGGVKCAPLVEMPIAMGVCIVKDAGIGLLQPETLGCIADINDFFGD